MIKTIDRDPTTGVAHVRLEGRLDTGSAPDVQRRLDALLHEGADKVLVDFHELDYISSAGLRVFLMTAKKLRGSGGSIRFCEMNASVTEVFEISGFGRIFELFPTREAALEGF